MKPFVAQSGKEFPTTEERWTQVLSEAGIKASGRGKEVGLKYFRVISDALMERCDTTAIEGAVSSHSYQSPRYRQAKVHTPTSDASDDTPLSSKEVLNKLARHTFSAEDTFEMSRYDEAMDRELNEVREELEAVHRRAECARLDLSFFFEFFRLE